MLYSTVLEHWEGTWETSLRCFSSLYYSVPQYIQPVKTRRYVIKKDRILCRIFVSSFTRKENPACGMWRNLLVVFFGCSFPGYHPYTIGKETQWLSVISPKVIGDSLWNLNRINSRVTHCFMCICKRTVFFY